MSYVIFVVQMWGAPLIAYLWPALVQQEQVARQMFLLLAVQYIAWPIIIGPIIFIQP